MSEKPVVGQGGLHVGGHGALTGIGVVEGGVALDHRVAVNQCAGQRVTPRGMVLSRGLRTALVLVVPCVPGELEVGREALERVPELAEILRQADDGLGGIGERFGISRVDQQVPRVLDGAGRTGNRAVGILVGDSVRRGRERIVPDRPGGGAGGDPGLVDVGEVQCQDGGFRQVDVHVGPEIELVILDGRIVTVHVAGVLENRRLGEVTSGNEILHNFTTT